jgi:hypothetical protein
MVNVGQAAVSLPKEQKLDVLGSIRFSSFPFFGRLEGSDSVREEIK